jgi:hypothetical protein
MYLMLSVAGNQTVFRARTRGLSGPCALRGEAGLFRTP